MVSANEEMLADVLSEAVGVPRDEAAVSMKMNGHGLPRIDGRYVTLREVGLSDAAFILRLRTSEVAQRLLHRTEGGLARQEEFLRAYFDRNDQWYFIVEDKAGEPIGTIGASDPEGDGLCLGWWLMSENANALQSRESAMLMRDYAFLTIGCGRIWWYTRVQNQTMREFARLCGDRTIRSDGEFVYFESDRDSHFRTRDAFLVPQDAPAGSSTGNLAKLVDVFTETFGVDAVDVPDLRYRKSRNWDSIRHLTLIGKVEGAFRVRMAPGDVLDFMSFEKGREILASRYGLSF